MFECIVSQSCVSHAFRSTRKEGPRCTEEWRKMKTAIADSTSEGRRSGKGRQANLPLQTALKQNPSSFEEAKGFHFEVSKALLSIFRHMPTLQI